MSLESPQSKTSRPRPSAWQVVVLLLAAYVQLVALDTMRALILGATLIGSVVEPLETHPDLAWPISGLLFGAGTLMAAWALSRRDSSRLVTKLPAALIAGG